VSGGASASMSSDRPIRENVLILARKDQQLCRKAPAETKTGVSLTGYLGIIHNSGF